MRELAYHVATSVDGYLAKPDHSFDCFAMEGDHVTDFIESLKGYDTVVMGRRTYEVGLKAGVDDPYPWMDTWVFGRSMKEAPSPRVQLVADDAAAAVRRLKERDGPPIYLCGGGAFAASLFEADLIDVVRVKVNPIVLGDGVPFAPGLRAVRGLALESTHRYESGVVLLSYRVNRT